MLHFPLGCFAKLEGVGRPNGCVRMLDERHRMEDEYQRLFRSPLRRFLKGLLSLGGDYRHPASMAAFESSIESQCAKGICVSIGGGPFRAHPRLLNLNIDQFPNVDLVGNAYHLPFRSLSVSLIHCEAVLEHLEYPNRAVEEIHRVLEIGGKVFAVTPFLQAFHGYPNHYQNFTLEGHRRLFERAGFDVSDAGTCVGPIYGLTDLSIGFFVSLFPGFLGQLLSLPWRFISLLLRPFDRLFWKIDRSHRFASTTFVLAKKLEPPKVSREATGGAAEKSGDAVGQVAGMAGEDEEPQRPG